MRETATTHKFQPLRSSFNKMGDLRICSYGSESRIRKLMRDYLTSPFRGFCDEYRFCYAGETQTVSAGSLLRVISLTLKIYISTSQA